jgi:hypothetical protein
LGHGNGWLFRDGWGFREDGLTGTLQARWGGLRRRNWGFPGRFVRHLGEGGFGGLSNRRLKVLERRQKNPEIMGEMLVLEAHEIIKGVFQLEVLIASKLA